MPRSRRAALTVGAAVLLAACASSAGQSRQPPVEAGPSTTASTPPPSSTPSTPSTPSTSLTPSTATRPSRTAPAKTAVDADAPTGWGPTQGELIRAAHIITRLSLRQRAAQLVMPIVQGRSATRVTSGEAGYNAAHIGAPTPAEAIEQGGFGGVLLSTWNISDPAQVAALTSGLQQAAHRSPAGLPLLISVDQEGGPVTRLRGGFTAMPSPRSIGDAGAARLARHVARDSGQELRAVGFTMVFAPDADVAAEDSFIGDRSFGDDPPLVARIARASVRGYLDAGVIPTLKHFPGHGDVVGDSHVMLPRQDRSLAELLETDLVPFRRALAAGAPAVMAGHLDIRALDPGVPGSMSPEVVDGLLRRYLGFSGVVVTDALDMAPVYEAYGIAHAAVHALRAGDDILLQSPQPLVALHGVVRAVRSGRLPASRVADAATRVVALKLYQQRIGAHRPAMDVLDSAAHRADAAAVFAR